MLKRNPSEDGTHNGRFHLLIVHELMAHSWTSTLSLMRYTHPVQTAEQLNQDFALDQILTFDEPTPGMPRARVATSACTAELYLQGAHLTRWQPTGQEPVLFLSECSAFTPGKAIRGGIPVVFPWFGSPETSPVHPPAGAPSHGFARIWPWTLHFAALADENLHLSLTLDQTEGIRALGFDGFQLAYELILGPTLTARLTVAHTGPHAGSSREGGHTGPHASSSREGGRTGGAPFRFEEALHTYLHVGDAREVSIEGLADTKFLDKTDNFRRKTQTDPALRFAAETDRPYLNTTAPLTLTDPTLRRRLAVSKFGSNTTVIWNPGPTLAAKLPDLGDEEWQHFACIESANAAENMVDLLPNQVHTLETHLSVHPF